MEPLREGFSMKQPTKKDRDRPRRAVRESQLSGKTSSTSPFNEGMEGIPEPARPSTHGRRPSISDWIDMITQAVEAIVGPSFNSHSGRLEAAKMVETARRLGA